MRGQKHFFARTERTEGRLGGDAGRAGRQSCAMGEREGRLTGVQRKENEPNRDATV